MVAGRCDIVDASDTCSAQQNKMLPIYKWNISFQAHIHKAIECLAKMYLSIFFHPAPIFHNNKYDRKKNRSGNKMMTKSKRMKRRKESKRRNNENREKAMAETSSTTMTTTFSEFRANVNSLRISESVCKREWYIMNMNRHIFENYANATTMKW